MTALVAEDQRGVRDVVARVLEGAGFLVHAVGSGPAALESARQIEGALTLLVADVGLPGMAGSALASEIRRLHPGVSVLFVSGHVREELNDRGLLSEHDDFLEKPFTPRLLLEAVEALLARGGPAAPASRPAMPSGR